MLALPKFMQTLDDSIYRELEKDAKRRGVSIQELIRAVIVPEWVTDQTGSEAKEAPSPKLNKWPLRPTLPKHRPQSSGL